MEKKYTLSFWLMIIGTALGVIAVCMIFLPAMSTAVSGTEVKYGLYSGFELIFGRKERGIEIIGFSVGNFISIAWIILGIAALLLNLFKVRLFGAKSEAITAAIACALLIIGGVLSTFAITFANTCGIDWSMFTNTLREGPVLTGILSIIAGGCAFAPIVLKMKNDSTTKSEE